MIRNLKKTEIVFHKLTVFNMIWLSVNGDLKKKYWRCKGCWSSANTGSCEKQQKNNFHGRSWSTRTTRWKVAK